MMQCWSVGAKGTTGIAELVSQMADKKQLTHVGIPTPRDKSMFVAQDQQLTKIFTGQFAQVVGMLYGFESAGR
jgi:hypothetical protein